MKMVRSLSNDITTHKSQRKSMLTSSICKLSLKVNNNRKKKTRSEEGRIAKKYRLIYRDSPPNTTQYLIDEYEKSPTTSFGYDDDTITEDYESKEISQGTMKYLNEGKLSLIIQTDEINTSTEYDESTSYNSNLFIEPDFSIKEYI